MLLGRPWLCGLFVGSVPSHIAALKFPVYTESWSADEEERLLEAMEIYGYGSWKTISEHLGTKDAVTCKAHYYQVYLDGSKNAPLPESDRIIAHEDEWTDASGANEGSAIHPEVWKLAVLRGQGRWMADHIGAAAGHAPWGSGVATAGQVEAVAEAEQAAAAEQADPAEQVAAAERVAAAQQVTEVGVAN